MKRLIQFGSFAMLAAITAACVLSDKDEAKRKRYTEPKGDAIKPTAVFVDGCKVYPEATYLDGLRALLPNRRVLRWVLFWLS